MQYKEIVVCYGLLSEERKDARSNSRSLNRKTAIMTAGAHSFADASYKHCVNDISLPDPKGFQSGPLQQVDEVLL